MNKNVFGRRLGENGPGPPTAGTRLFILFIVVIKMSCASLCVITLTTNIILQSFILALSACVPASSEALKGHMTKLGDTRKPANRSLPKAPTGIQGLDEITGGGLPRGRPTLVCGTAGCGKTLLAMEFLVRRGHAVPRAGRVHGL